MRALYLDQYCLTMAQSFWKNDMNDVVSFELFVRTLPEHRKYLVTAGLGTALWWIQRMGFNEREDKFLTDELGLDKRFIRWLGEDEDGRVTRFRGDIWAIPEGTLVGAETPILRVTGKRIEATLIESALLSIINHQTMIASKAARIVEAAGRRPVWDFSLRRLHGPEASIGVARASYIAGCYGTATVEAARLLGIPTTGTSAHHYIMAFGEEREREAYKQFLVDNPENHALLVDTYDIRHGVEKAILASKETGIPLKAIRIDSGDLAFESLVARRMLDHEGGQFRETQILTSGDLDESKIHRLRGYPIDAYGVGTMLGTSADAPYLGGVYKLVEQHEREPRFVMKLSKSKATEPGRHQVFRRHTIDGPVDTLGLVDEHGGLEFGYPILEKVMEGGRIVAGSLSATSDLLAVRARCRSAKGFGYPKELGRTPALQALRTKLAKGGHSFR